MDPGLYEEGHHGGRIAGLKEAAEMVREDLEYHGKNHSELKALLEEIEARISSISQD